MDQATARWLARRLSVDTKRIYVAITEDHLRGQYDGPDPVWVVARWDGPPEVIRTVPGSPQ
jgi:hypothetical protein